MPDAFSSVPEIDFARLAAPETKTEELDKLREAIFVVGFLYLTNTGLEVRGSPSHGAWEKLSHSLGLDLSHP